MKAIVSRLAAAGVRFEPIAEATWVPIAEGKFGRRLPESFRSLVTVYAFPEFDVGGISVFSNLNDGSPLDITVAPFADPFMSAWLISRGYLQFGRPDTGSYDPVCFDFSSGKNDPPVVVLDHEDILLERRKIAVQPLAESFLELMEAGLHGKAP
jgi:hypothetical protein